MQTKFQIKDAAHSIIVAAGVAMVVPIAVFCASYGESAVILLAGCVMLLVAWLSPREYLPVMGMILVALHSATLFPALAGLGQDGVQKIALIAVMAVLIIRTGYRVTLPIWPVVIPFTLVFVFNITTATYTSVIGGSGIFRAFLGYVFAWFLLNVRWTERGALATIRLVSFLPLVSVVLGGMLHLLGVSSVYRIEYTGAFRLSGAAIPAHLAMLAFVAVCASIYLVLRENASGSARILVILNLTLLAATVTRGAILAALLMLVLICAGVIGAGSGVSREINRFIKQLAVATVVLGVAIWPQIAIRNAGNGYESGLNTSGRDDAWAFYLRLAEQNTWVGNGLGFGNIANRVYHPANVQAAFEAPHNEYLHLYLDMGILGAIAVGIGFAVLFFAVRRATQGLTRTLVSAFFAATCLYAYFDNVLSTVQFTVPFALLIGAICSLPSRGSHGYKNVKDRMMVS